VELRQLRYFVAAAEAGSFRGAAARLGTQQPTISQHMQKLEDRLNTDLFERHARGARLTHAGEHLLRVARRIIADVDQALRHATEVAKAEAGAVSIGFYTSLSAGPLRDAIAAYRAAMPKVLIDLLEGSPPDLLTALQQRRIDVAFTVGEVARGDIEKLHLWDEPLLAAVPEGCPLAQRESVTWADLAPRPLVVRTWESGPVLCTFLAGRLTPHALTPQIAQHFISREALLSAVGLGFGITVVGASAAGLTYPGVAFRPIAEPDASIPVIALWLPDNDNPVRQKFVAGLRDRISSETRQSRSK
jgi:DNA-binding transcriptional LysR family regulator